jgi:hypothetical protein
MPPWKLNSAENGRACQNCGAVENHPYRKVVKT